MAGKALVLGAGRSGRGAARLLLQEGWQVTVVDERVDVAPVSGGDIRLVAGCRDLPAEPFGLAVVSPGFRPDHPWVRALREKGVPVQGELDLGWKRAAGTKVAVTGSNGKSTAVKWIAATLERTGREVRVAGNCETGPSMSEAAAAHSRADWWVVEVSSFQLEYASEVRPDYSLVLDVHPNHLDRHGSLSRYAAIKLSLAEATRRGGTAVVPAGLRERLNQREMFRVVTFGSDGEPADFVYRAGGVVAAGSGEEIPLQGTLWSDPRRGRGAAAVIALLVAAGIEPREAVSVFRGLPPLPHRMEMVGVFGGVRVVDDSKATNPAAAAAALEAVEGRVRWIAGGRPKQKDFTELREVAAAKAAAVYLYGEAAEAMRRQLNGTVRCRVFHRLEEAVEAAWEEAMPGETLLLSPACASFDQFEDFARRGEEFVAQVKRLAKEV